MSAVRRTLLAACALAWLGILVVAVLAVDEDPVSAAIVVGCGGQLCASLAVRLRGGAAIEKHLARELTGALFATSAVVVGVAAAVRGAPPLAVGALGLFGGLYLTELVEVLSAERTVR